MAGVLCVFVWRRAGWDQHDAVVGSAEAYEQAVS